MATAVKQQSEVERLVAMVDDPNPYEASFAELEQAQIAAVNERFQARVRQIKLLGNRAEEGGISEVRRMEDIVPLLFAHTTYKSYPEAWLTERKWDRMGRWLSTVSTGDVQPMDLGGVQGLDDWLALLERHGHYVSCSSGTTGKCAMMNAVAADLAFSGHSLLQNVRWAGLAPDHDRRLVSMGQVAATAKNAATGRPMMEAFSLPGVMPSVPDVPPITIGGITEMVVTRRRIAEGAASPDEVAAYEAKAAEREAAIHSSVEQAADALIRHRGDKLHLTGLFAPLYQVAERVRSLGYSGRDFQPNSLFIAGGLKRAQVPENYREIIYDTFNLAPERVCLCYGMQELNTNAVMCPHGRYHVAPWVVLLLLDESGERLIAPPAAGEAEGRAGFFDLSMEGRWGGVISGDKIRASWEPCACGNRSPSIDADIQRFADTAGGDKIACSGTIDAYVRGVA